MSVCQDKQSANLLITCCQHRGILKEEQQTDSQIKKQNVPQIGKGPCHLVDAQPLAPPMQKNCEKIAKAEVQANRGSAR